MARTLVPTTRPPAADVPGLAAQFVDEGALGPEGSLWFKNPAYNPPVVLKSQGVEATSPDFGDGAFGPEGALWFTKAAYNPSAKPER